MARLYYRSKGEDKYRMDNLVLGVLTVAAGYTTFIILVCLISMRSWWFLLFLIVNMVICLIFLYTFTKYRVVPQIIRDKIGTTMANFLQNVDLIKWYCDFRNLL